MGDRVATTQWSQVLAARDGTETESRRALEELCQTYWQPLYAFVRRLGSDPDEAGDITQAYFAEMLEKDYLADVDAEKGRLRSFLFSSLRHFLYHQRDRSNAMKRGGGLRTLSLDMDAAERNYSIQPTEEMTPEDVFEVRWAMTVITRAMRRLRDEAVLAGNQPQFDHLKPYLTSFDPEVSYKEAGEALGMSDGAVRVAVHRLRRRFGKAMRAELAETVADPSQIDAEMKHLLSVLSR